MGARLEISIAVAMFLAVQLLAVKCSQQDSDENATPQKVVVKIHRPAKDTEYGIRGNLKHGRGAGSNRPPSEGKQGRESNEPKAQVTTQTPLPSQEFFQEDRLQNEQGWYHVTEKDTLIVIAGSSRVYSDPHKWISLLRLNLKALEPFGLDKGIETRELPQGLGLRYLTPREVNQRREQVRGRKWVVNILSDKGAGKISELAVKLVRNGISVYIASARIKGQQWLRLRAGFFANAAEAKQMRDNLQDMLGLTGLWVAKISDEEFDKYAGY